MDYEGSLRLLYKLIHIIHTFTRSGNILSMTYTFFLHFYNFFIINASNVIISLLFVTAIIYNLIYFIIYITVLIKI